MSSFIHDIEITNFKSIRHQKIEGCKRINVFIGYPNVGKSNVLEALSSVGLFHLVDVKPSFSVKDFIRLEKPSEIFFEGDWRKPTSISLNGGDVTEIISYGAHKPLRLLIKSSYKNEVSLHASLLFDSQLLVEKESLQKAISEKNNFRNGFSTSDSKPLLVKKYAFPFSIVRDNDYLGALTFPFGENLMQVLNEHSDLRKDVAGLLEPYNLKLGLDKTSDTIKAVRDYGDGTIFLLPYSLIADTLQRLIFYKAAIKSNTDTVLLFEEPEAHMFPPYIRTLTWDIISSKTNQFFIATHSPFVLDMLIEEANQELSIYLVDLVNGETIIKQLGKEEFEEVRRYGVDLFFNIESYLGHGQGDIA